MPAEATTEPDEDGAQPVSVGGLGRVVLRGVAFSGAGFVLTQGMTIATAIALARVVSPEEFGIYGSALILLGYAAMLADSGLQSAVIQRPDRVLEAASTAFAANVVTGIGLALVALASAPLLGLFFDNSTVKWVAAAMSATVALNALMLIPDALLQREFSFVRRLFVSPSAALTFGLVAGLTAAAGLGVWALVVGRYASIAVELIVIWALIDWRPRRSLMSISMWRSLARYGRHVFAASFLTQSRDSIFTALLGRFVSIQAVGQYRYATEMTTFPRLAWVMSSSYVVFPALARIAHEPERFRSAFLRTVRWMGIITFPSCALFLPLGPAVVVTLLGERWREAGYAVMALVGAPIAGGLASVMSEGVKSVGRPNVLSRTALVGVVAAIALLVAFVPLGVVGVAGGASIAAALTVGYMVRVGVPVLGVTASSILEALRPSFLATVLMVGALFPLEWLVVQADTRGTAVGILLLLAEGAVGLAVFLAALRVLDPDAVTTIGHGLHAIRGRLSRRRPVRHPAAE